MNALAIIKTLASAVSWQLLQDTLTAVLGRIQWTVVLERLLTRVLIGLLQWVKGLSTNDVVDETVDLIAAMLEQKRLLKATEYQLRQDRRTPGTTDENTGAND
ncbi:hypothetical protein [Parathalassolituus penaei]|uniref:Uncharacterized protein n=1 Tax=Parathalassolituus penaei TaxID=2997323 RepID=A0A9X3ENZ0_9GAMM|nr:hypothetical protein [Parathalassolituus penaei]MCY0966148.1 hypothetical protein [Parathalassolituus penaei]